MKKRDEIIIGIVLILIVGGILFFMFGLPGFSEKEILKDPSAAMTFCQESPQNKQDGCYSQISEVLALENTNVSLQACLAMNDKENKKICIEELSKKQSEANSDIELAMCDFRIGTDKDNCYRGVAEEFLMSNPTKTLEVCKKIENINSKDNCLENIIHLPEVIQNNSGLGITICDSVTLKSRCFNDLAQTISGSDPKEAAEICKQLSDEVQISNCYGSVWFSFDSIVLANPDFTISLCNALNAKRDDCLRRLSGVFMDVNRAKAAEICRLMSSSVSRGCLDEVQRG